MTHPRNAPRDSGGGEQTAAFLRDLRALRDQAGLGPRDLAARAHFPEATLVMAEAGPGLPSLPVVQAYVRGCGAPELEWEDRWRRLNSSDTGDSGSALPTRAPSSSRSAGRVLAADQEAVGFGLERVVRGLVPLSSDPAEPQRDAGPPAPFGGAPGGYGETNPSTGHSGSGNGSNGAGGWFDPAPKTPSDQSYSPPPAPPAPATPPVNPGAPTVQYPSVSGFQESDQSYASPTSYSGSSTPSYRLPEEFRTPAPPPPDLPGAGSAAPGGYGASGLGSGGGSGTGTGAGVAAPGTAGLGGSTGSGPWPSRSTASQPGASFPGVTQPGASHAASSDPGGPAATPAPPVTPAPAQRRTSGWVIAAVVIVLIIAAVVWLVVSH